MGKDYFVVCIHALHVGTRIALASIVPTTGGNFT